MKLKDNLLLGLILGLILPILGVVGFYLAEFAQMTFMDFIRMATQNSILSPLLSLCAILNLGLFYLFLNKNNLLTARGIILATILYGLTIILLKFVL